MQPGWLHGGYIDNSIITLGKREITLGPVGSAIFNMLALNAGQVISREQLRSAFNGLLDSTNLTSHINKLRVKLGRDDRQRIRTVTGVGYMNASPAKSVEGRSEVASQWRHAGLEI
jgi:DNA-binding response OmpR family regulator